MDIDGSDPLRPSRLLRRGGSVWFFRHDMTLLPGEEAARASLEGYVTCKLPESWPSRVCAKVRDIDVGSAGVYVRFQAVAFQIPVITGDELVWTIKTAEEVLDPEYRGTSRTIHYYYTRCIGRHGAA